MVRYRYRRATRASGFNVWLTFLLDIGVTYFVSVQLKLNISYLWSMNLVWISFQDAPAILISARRWKNQLFVHNPKTHKILEDLICSPPALDSQFFWLASIC